MTLEILQGACDRGADSVIIDLLRIHGLNLGKRLLNVLGFGTKRCSIIGLFARNHRLMLFPNLFLQGIHDLPVGPIIFDFCYAPTGRVLGQHAAELVRQL